MLRLGSLPFHHLQLFKCSQVNQKVIGRLKNELSNKKLLNRVRKIYIQFQYLAQKRRYLQLVNQNLDQLKFVQMFKNKSKTNIFNTSNEPSKLTSNIFSQKNPSANLFDGHSSSGTNIQRQSNQIASQKLQTPAIQLKQAPMNPFAEYQKYKLHLNFEQPLKNNSSICLTENPTTQKIQSPLKTVPNIFAPTLSVQQPVNNFLYPSNSNDKKSSRNNSIFTSPAPKLCPMNKQQYSKKKEEKPQFKQKQEKQIFQNGIQAQRQDIDLKQQKKSFETITQQSKLKNLISKAQNSEKIVQKQSSLFSVRKQGTQLTETSSLKLNQIKNDNLIEKQQKSDFKTLSNIIQDSNIDQNIDKKTETKQRVSRKLTRELINKNELLSTINQRSFQQSAIGVSQKPSQEQSADDNHSEALSYMDYKSSSNLSQIQNVISQKNTEQQKQIYFKTTSSNKLISYDLKNTQVKRISDQQKTKQLTISQYIEGKSEVYATRMTQSLKLSDKKPEQMKEPFSSEKKPKQIQKEDQKSHSITKKSIFSRNPSLIINKRRTFQDNAITKKPRQLKEVESEDEYQSNEQNQNQSNKLMNQTAKISQSNNTNDIIGKFSTIQSLRQNAKNYEICQLKTDPKNQQKKINSNNQKKMPIFSLVQQIDDKHKYQKKQQKSVKNQQQLNLQIFTKKNQQKAQDHQNSGTEKNLLPIFHRRITFGIDGNEQFSKEGIKDQIDQKPGKKRYSPLHQNLKNPVQFQAKLLRVGQNISNTYNQNSSVKPLETIEEATSYDKNLKYQISSPSLSKIRQYSQFSSPISSVRKATKKDLPQSSEKKIRGKKINEIKLLFEKSKFDFEQLKIRDSQQLQFIIKKEPSVTQNVLQSDGENLFMFKSFYDVFGSIAEYSIKFLRTNLYLSQIDKYNQVNKILKASNMGQIEQEILEKIEKICKKIPTKLAQFSSIVNNYQKEITQQKKIQLEQQGKKTLKQNKTSIFTLFNLSRNKYSSESQKRQQLQLESKSTKQYKSYAQFKNTILRILQQKKANLLKYQQNSKDCLKQPKRPHFIWIYKKNDEKTEQKTSNNRMSKFKQVLLEKNQRQKIDFLKVIKQNKSNKNLNKPWESLFLLKKTKSDQLNLIRRKVQLVVKDFWNLSFGYSYLRLLNFADKHLDLKKQEEKTTDNYKIQMQKIKEICETKQRYIRMEQNFIQYSSSQVNNNQDQKSGAFQKSREQLQEYKIYQKRRMNQQIISKGRNITVKLKNIYFQLAPFQSSELLKKYKEGIFIQP